MLIDVTRLVLRRLKGRLPTGVDRVALAYVERYGLGLHRAAAPGSGSDGTQALLRLGRRHGVASPRASHELFRWLCGPLAAPVPWSALAGALAAGCPRAGALDSRWLIHAAHSGLEHDHWAADLRAAGVRPLVVVHDLIPITHPQFCRAGEAQRHIRRMRHALAWAGALVTNSAATRDALTTWAVQSGLPLPPLAVAHLGPGGASVAASTAADEPPLRQPYFVCLGTLEPRKNHGLLLMVWQRLLERHGAAAAPRLVLVGQRGWEIDHVGRLLDRTPGLREAVIELPRCDDASLRRWLAHARALLFPSFAEGYGMPMVEALAQGSPVIASDLAAFQEVAGAVPEYRDPLDGLGWLEAIEAYAEPGSRAREAQLQRLRAFRAPDWRGHFERVDALMAGVGQPSPRLSVRPARPAAALRVPEAVDP